MSEQKIRVEVSHYRKDEFEKLVDDAKRAGFSIVGGVRIEYGRYNATLETAGSVVPQEAQEYAETLLEVEEIKAEEASPKRKRKPKVKEE